MIEGIRLSAQGHKALQAEVSGAQTSLSFDRVALLATCPRDKHGYPWLTLKGLLARTPNVDSSKLVDNMIWLERHGYLEIARTKQVSTRASITLEATTDDGYKLAVTLTAPANQALNPDLDDLGATLLALLPKVRDLTSELSL